MCFCPIDANALPAEWKSCRSIFNRELALTQVAAHKAVFTAAR